jgi:hypothetical protein
MIVENNFIVQKIDDAEILSGNIMFYATKEYQHYGYYAELDFLEVFEIVLRENLESILDFMNFADRDTEIREGFKSEVAR